MSRGVNKVILIGNCGSDPETRSLPSGGSVTSLTLATSETWKDKNTGSQQEKTEWHRLVFFNRLAEIVAEYVRKGAKIYVEGSIRTRSWEKDGQKQYATEIVVNEMQLLDSRNGGPAERVSEPQQKQSPRDEKKSAYDDFEDSDLPF